MSIATTSTTIFSAVGKPRIETIWQTVRLVILVALIYPFTMRWGVVGTSIAVLLSILVPTLGFSFMIIKITQCSVRKFCKMLIVPIISTAITLSAIIYLKTIFRSIDVWQFILLILVGCINYFFITYLFDKFLDYGIRKLIKDTLAF